MNAAVVARTNVGTNQDVLTHKAATDAVVLQDFTWVEMDEAVMVSNKTAIILAGNKNFIVSFERDFKIIYRSLLQNFYICLIFLF